MNGYEGREKGLKLRGMKDRKDVDWRWRVGMGKVREERNDM